MDTLCHTSCRSGIARPNKAGFLLYEGKGQHFVGFALSEWCFFFLVYFISWSLGQDLSGSGFRAGPYGYFWSGFRVGLCAPPFDFKFFGLALGQVLMDTCLGLALGQVLMDTFGLASGQVFVHHLCCRKLQLFWSWLQGWSLCTTFCWGLQVFWSGFRAGPYGNDIIISPVWT